MRRRSVSATSTIRERLRSRSPTRAARLDDVDYDVALGRPAGGVHEALQGAQAPGA